MTTQDAAKRLNCSPITVRQAIGQGRLTAQKFGRDWMIIEDEKFKTFTLSKAGRPSKTKKADSAL